MKPPHTPINQFENLQSHLAHYNQILRSKPIVVTRHKEMFKQRSPKIQKRHDSQRKDHNNIMLNKLLSIKYRSKKSFDDSILNKTTLKNEYKQRQKRFDIHMNNLKLFNKLRSVKSSFKTSNISHNQNNSRRQRFSQTLNYQNQVYKTFSNFMRYDINARIFLRTQKDTSDNLKRQNSSKFKFQIKQLNQQHKSKTKTKRKHKRRASNQSQCLKINKKEDSSLVKFPTVSLHRQLH